MKTFDGQRDFSGGMVDRLAPDALAPNQYAYGENIEIRDGAARTRRGSIAVHEWIDAGTCQGVGVYRAPLSDQRKETILMVVDGTPYRQNMPQPPAEMDLPAGVTIDTDERVRFVQAFEYVYMLRGPDKFVLRWDGYNANAWTLLSAPAAGDLFPQCSYAIYAYNRIWAAVDGDTLVASDLLSEAFDLTMHAYEIDSGDGGDIVAVAAFGEGALVVLKEHSVHLLTNCNGDLTALAREVVDMDHGCVGPDAVVVAGRDVSWFSHDGVRTLALTEQSKVQGRDVTLTHPIPELRARVNIPAATDAHAVVFDNYALFAVPLDEAVAPDSVLVYDLLLQTWVGVWTGLACRWFVRGHHPKEALWGFNAAGDAHALLEDTFWDAVPTWQPYVATGGKSFITFPSIASAPATSDGEIRLLFRMLDLNMEFPHFYELVNMFQGESPLLNRIQIMFYPATGQLYALAELEWVSQWGLISAENVVTDMNWHTLVLRQDGTEPQLWLDGGRLDVTWVYDSDKTFWWDSFSGEYAVQLGSLGFVDPNVNGFGLECVRFGALGGATLHHAFVANDDGQCVDLVTDAVGVPGGVISPDFYHPLCGMPAEQPYMQVGISGAVRWETGESWLADSTGDVRLQFRRSGGDGGVGPIFSLVDSGTNGYITCRLYQVTNTLQLEAHNGAAYQWQFRLPAEAIPEDDTDWHSLFLAQTGTYVKAYLDGALQTPTWLIETDKTFWWDSFTGNVHITVGYGDTILDPPWPNEMYIERLSVIDSDELPRFYVYVDRDGVIREGFTGEAGTYHGSIDPVTYVPDPATLQAIPATLLTRAYTLGAPDREKRFGMGEVAFAHRNPSLSATLLAENTNEETSLFADAEFDQTVYDIHGADAWDGSGATHDDPHRQDYTPLELDDSGISLPDAGITLDMEQVHTRKFHADAVARAAQLRLENDQGTVAVREIRLTGTVRAPGRRT